jgi:hypothetical protein
MEFVRDSKGFWDVYGGESLFWQHAVGNTLVGSLRGWAGAVK